jgi:hypothetical protein
MNFPKLGNQEFVVAEKSKPPENSPVLAERWYRPVQNAESVVAEALLDSNHHGHITEEWAAELARIAVAGLVAAGLLNDGTVNTQDRT